MARVFTLQHGIPLSTSRGSLAFCSQILVIADSGRKIVFDCGFANDREELLAALAQHDLTPDGIDILVLSHLHTDHCANAVLFRKSRVVVSAEEFAYAEREAGRDHYVYDFVDALFSRLDLVRTSGDVELEPDVKLIETPGHTDGHMSLLARTDEGVVGLAGDAAKSITELIGSKAARGLASTTSAERSVARLFGECQTIIPGHDRAVRVMDGRVVLDGQIEALDLKLRFY